MAVLVLCYLLFSLYVHRGASLSFSYASFNSAAAAGDFRAEDDARVTGGKIELLGDESGSRARGRAWYRLAPVQLWDDVTGEAASFATSFSFSIVSAPGRSGGHGMAFFLAPYPPELPQESYEGYLGLFDGSLNYSTANVSGMGRFVAVEFDTQQNVWDPSGRHVGIDVYNVDSHGNYMVLPNDSLVDAGPMSATVGYDGGTTRLDVTLTNGSATYTLNATIDLKSLLPPQVAIGFSAATGDKFAGQHYVLSFSFNSTLEAKDSISLSLSTKKTTVPLAAVVAVAAALVLVLVVAVAALVWRSRKKELSEDMTATEDDSLIGGDEDYFTAAGTGPRRIPYSQLAAATGNFAEETKLGEGASGSVYRGHMKELGRDVAIKVFFKGATSEGKKEYKSEVTVISRLRHRNLVQLIGWFHGRKRLLLVYELVSNGSLDKHLHDKDGLLTWPMRYQIVIGLGSAVLYLHQEWEQCVVHGDIKPSNIMLDESFNPKLGDFGLARLIDHGMSLQTMTAMAGTPGYLDPECIITGKACTESDIYSFGVVLLEIASGKRPMMPPPRGQKDIFRLVEWVWDLYGQMATLEVVDKRLGCEFDKWEIERVMVVGLWCAHPDPRMRPTIKQAIEALQSRKFKMPILPPKMPVAMYLQPLTSTMQYDSTSSSVGSLVTMQYSSTPMQYDIHPVVASTI